MGWKNLPAWLKGGVILLIINIFLILLYFGIKFVIFLSLGNVLPGDHPIVLIYLPSFLITDGLYWGRNTPMAIFIFSSISYFIVGVIIGWIVGKIKKS